MARYVVADQADYAALIAAGVPRSDIEYSGSDPNAGRATSSNGYGATTGLRNGATDTSATWVGLAAQNAPTDAYTLAGDNRADTANLIKSAVTANADPNNALATLRQTLDQYGLGSLANWAWNELVGGKSQDQILLDMQQTDAFKQRFPAIGLRQKAGLPAISPADYINYENQARDLMSSAGLPAAFYAKPSDFTNLIASDVSLNELSQRVSDAKSMYYESPPAVRAYWAQAFGGGQQAAGAMAAHFLDPDVAEPVLHQQFQAAQVGGAAAQAGWGNLSAEDAQQLASQGVSYSQAQNAFGQLANESQLFSALPGERTTGISQQEQLGAAFGNNAADQQAIERARGQRVGVFQSGGGFTQSGAGQAQQA